MTVEHLLAHRSGIGDYLDEEAGGDITDYVMPDPRPRLGGDRGDLAVLDGYPTVFPAGERFAYCNGGYVVLALIAERASGTPFHDLVRERGWSRRAWATRRTSAPTVPPGGPQARYLTDDGPRTNVLHLPVRGSGDGGVYSTAADIAGLWRAFLAGLIVPQRWAAEMVRPRSDVPAESRRYGLGFRLHESTDAVAPRGVRRRRLVPKHARPRIGDDANGHLEHVGGSLGHGRAPALRARRIGSGGRLTPLSTSAATSSTNRISGRAP